MALPVILQVNDLKEEQAVCCFQPWAFLNDLTALVYKIRYDINMSNVYDAYIFIFIQIEEIYVHIMIYVWISKYLSSFL